MSKILITGASGQIGSVLTEKLKEKYGTDNIIATDLHLIDLISGKNVGDMIAKNPLLQP